MVFKSWLSVYFTFYNARFCSFVAGQIDVVFLFEFLDGFFLDVAVRPFQFQFDVYVVWLEDFAESYTA